MLVSDSFTWFGSISQEVLSQKAWMNQFRCRMLCERVRAAESLMQSRAIAGMRCEIARCITQFIGWRFCFVTKNTRFLSQRGQMSSNYCEKQIMLPYHVEHCIQRNTRWHWIEKHYLATFKSFYCVFQLSTVKNLQNY